MPTKKSKESRRQEKGPGIISRMVSAFSVDEEKRKKIVKVTGLLVAAFAVFTFIASLSYLFTWKADQSLLYEQDMMSEDAVVHNSAGKLGYRWGHFLVARCFGLGSFAFVLLLCVIAARLLFGKRRTGILKAFLVTVTGAVAVSVLLSFVSGLFGPDTAFGGGLGGGCGAAIVAWSSNLVGKPVTFILILILIVAWLLYSSSRFSGWLLSRFDRRPSAASATAVSCGQQLESGETENEVRDADVSEGADDTDPFYVPDEAEPVPDADDDDFVPEPVPDDSTDAGEPVPDTGLEVIKEELASEVKKELPRIDIREELQNYRFPTLDFLNDYPEGRHDVSDEELERNNNKIRATLMSYKIQVEKVSACVGPTVTLYKIVPAQGVKISSIRNLEEDIALSLGAKGVRVVTLEDAVGIEVPNDKPSIVPLKYMLNDDTFRNNRYELPIAIGATITNKVKVFDLADSPHLLIAGATKQGKSVGLNVIITSLLYSKHPSELKFVFIDPKMVEFTAYSKLLKHFLAVLPDAADEKEEMENAVVKKPKQAEEILRSLCIEMDERFALFSKAGVNELKLYNDKYRDRKLLPTDGHRFMPYMVVVIDEYADLIMSGPMGGDSKSMARSITTSIIRLAQKGRAAGIHVIIATQRPSVDVITGLIKTNFPTRIAFRVSTRVDSSTIIDSPGAERLIGKGDMLYYAGVDSERAQCALVDLEEINAVTNFIASQTGYKKSYNTPYYLPSVNNDDGSGGGMINMQDLDEMFEEAAKLVVTTQQGSTSNLQRRLGFGYARAGKVMDQLEAAGIVGPQEGSKPRQVLIPDLASLEPVLKAFMN